MYCTQCGKQLQDGAAFCPACGRKVPVKRPPAEQAPQERGEVLYTSKGYPESYYRWARITTVACIAVGIFFMILSQSKHGSSRVSYYAGGTLVHSGTLGGGSMFTSEGQQGLFLVGVICILLGIGLFFAIRRLRNAYALTLYEHQIVGVKSFARFTLDYGQVTETLSDVSSLSQSVTIVTPGNRYRVIVSHDAHQAAEIIRARCRGREGGS